MFEIPEITTPLRFFSNFLLSISSTVRSLTVIFKESISVSLVVTLGFISALKSSEDSSLPKVNFLVNNFLFLHISSSTNFPTSVRETNFGKVLIVSIFLPSNFKMISPALSPAFSAGLFSPTLAIKAPSVFVKFSTSAISLVTS